MRFTPLFSFPNHKHIFDLVESGEIKCIFDELAKTKDWEATHLLIHRERKDFTAHVQIMRTANQAHQMWNATVFEIALREIVARQSRSHHLVQLAIATCTVGVICSVVGTVFAVVWQRAEMPFLFSPTWTVCYVVVLSLLRMIRKRYGLESEEVYCQRVNECLQRCQLDIAYDLYSGRLFSRDSRARLGGHSANDESST